MLQVIETYLRENREAFAPTPLSACEPLRAAIITGGGSVHSKLISLWWRGTASLPCLVVKFPRYAHDNQRLADEYAALCRLQEYLPRGTVHVPRPVASDVRDGLQLAVESVVPGRPLRAALCERREAAGRSLRDLGPLARWLGSLHARSARSATPAEIERLVLAPLATVERAFNLSSRERIAVARLRSAASALACRVALPLVFAHGDMDTSNVIVDATGRPAGLVDWESAGIGLPLQDLAYFLARYAYEAHAAGHPDQLRGFRRLFFDHPRRADDPFGPHLVTSWCDAYLRDIALAPEWLHVLFALTWIMHARNEKDAVLRLRDEGQVLYGRPAGITAVATDEATLSRGHFRSHLRCYLENLDACTALNRIALLPR